MTPQTLKFLRSLCDQVKLDPPLTTPEARQNTTSLWAAVDELDSAIAAAGTPSRGATDAST